MFFLKKSALCVYNHYQYIHKDNKKCVYHAEKKLESVETEHSLADKL